MWIPRAVVTACIAARGAESAAHGPEIHSVAWNPLSSKLDLFPLLDPALRREVTLQSTAVAPEPMSGDNRTMVYPMVPAPTAGQSGIAFGGLILVLFAWRFWQYGRITAR